MTSILAQGIYPGIPSRDYHADPCLTPSLSSGILRTIIDRGGVALAHAMHPRLGGTAKEQSDALTAGSLVHALMAGDADDTIEFGDFESYHTKASQDWRDGVLAIGKTPALPHAREAARTIADALKFRIGDAVNEGNAEVSAFWQEGGHWFRCRFDRLIIGKDSATFWDWKTCKNASPDAIAKSIAGEGYHIQAYFYRRGLLALKPELAGRINIRFAFVEKTQPYSVRIVQFSEAYLELAEGQAHRAICQWKQALETGDWSDPQETLTLTPPSWLVSKSLDQEMADWEGDAE